MAQINLKNDGNILTPPSGSLAIGLSSGNIILKDDTGHSTTVIGGEPLPSGGTIGQILAKKSSDNYQAEWINFTGGTQSSDYLYLSDYSLNVDSNSGTDTVKVYSTKNWTLSNGSFVNASQTSGTTGETTITLSYTENSLSESRNNKIIITSTELGISQSLNIVQKSAVKSTYYLSLSDNSITKLSGDTTSVFQVISTNNWSLSNSGFTTPTITSGTSGTTTITLNFNQNSTSKSRNDVIVVTDGITTQSLNLTQQGIDQIVEYINIDPNSDTVTSESGTTTFSIDSNISWNIPTTISGITISPTSGNTGRTDIDIDYPENTSVITTKRIIRIDPVDSSISYKNYTLNQLPPTDNYYIVSQSAIVIPSGQTSADIVISSNVDWEITSGSTWITNYSSTSGTGNATVSLTIEVNNEEDTRQTSIIISCTNRNDVTPVVVTLSQTGTSGFNVSKAPSIIPKSKTVSNISGTTDIDIVSARSWELSEDVDWLIASPTGDTGNSTVTLTYTENTGTERTAFLSITDTDDNTANFYLIQGSTDSVIVKPDTFEVTKQSGSISVDIRSTGEWETDINNVYGSGLTTSIVPSSGNTSITSAVINYDENTSDDFKYSLLNFYLKGDTNKGTQVKIKHGVDGGDGFGNIGGSRITSEIESSSGTTLSAARLYR